MYLQLSRLRQLSAEQSLTSENHDVISRFLRTLDGQVGACVRGWKEWRASTAAWSCPGSLSLSARPLCAERACPRQQ
jgi:hypothetical protein